jgi:ATP-binding cassette, subfamily B, bacterial
VSHVRQLRKAVPKLGALGRRIAPYLGKYRALLVGSFLALFAQVGTRLLEPWPLKLIFDGVLGLGPEAGVLGTGGWPTDVLLAVACLSLVVVIALRALAQYATTVGFALAGNRVLTEVRGVLYDHLQRLPLSYHAGTRGGDLTLRVIGDVGMLKEVAVTALLPLVGNTVILVGMLGVMLWMHAELALLAVAVFPAFWWIGRRQGMRIHAASRKQRRREGAMASTAAESLAAIQLVQSLSLERAFARTFDGANAKSLKDGVRIKRLSAGLERSVDVLIAVATAVVLWFGTRQVLTGALTGGDLLVFVTYLKSAFRPMRDFAKYTARIAKAAAASDRVLEVLDTEPAVRDRPDAVSAAGLRGDLRFSGVRFRYPGGPWVLDGLDVDVPAGSSVAFVGPSGAGKSTVASLVSRLHDVAEGSVSLDGRDLRAYRLRSLRKRVAVVLQDNVLFGGSVRENLTVGLDGVDDDAVRGAAELARAHEFVDALPDGYDTHVGERGATLSGGQRQRLAIARAALRDTPVLVLDEPTSGLDEDNRRWVAEALWRLARGRTTVLITHDLGLARHADRIVYLERGVAREQGTHEELLAAGGPYAATYRAQNAGAAPAGAATPAWAGASA